MADDIVPLGFGGSGGGTNLNNSTSVNVNTSPPNQANTGSTVFPAQGTQPQVGSTQTPYQWQVPTNGKIRLDGRFDSNFIEWDRVDLSKIKKVENTKFRFILVIKNNEFDENPILYTSNEYYTDLELSLRESNPYFSLLSFERPFVVEVSLDGLTKKVNDFLPAEEENGALVLTNLHVTRDYESGSYNITKQSIDHYPLIRYIDWLVSPRDSGNLLNTTIPVEELGVFNIFPTGSSVDTTITNTLSPSWTWGGQFISNSETQNQGVFKTDSNAIVTTLTFLINQISSTPTSYLNTNLLDDAIAEPELFKLRLSESQTIYHEFLIDDVTDITQGTSTYKFDVTILSANTATPIFKANTPYKIEIKPYTPSGGGGNGGNPVGGL
jgi:hypothetical protein